MTKNDPKKLKIKLILKVDKALYDRIVEQAKEEKLEGTIEDVLKNCCYGWFKGWETIFKKMDNPELAQEAAELDAKLRAPSGLVGLNGEPLGRA